MEIRPQDNRSWLSFRNRCSCCFKTRSETAESLEDDRLSDTTQASQAGLSALKESDEARHHHNEIRQEQSDQDGDDRHRRFGEHQGARDSEGDDKVRCHAVSETQTSKADSSTSQGTGQGTKQGTGQGTSQGTGQGTRQGTSQGTSQGTRHGPGTFSEAERLLSSSPARGRLRTEGGFHKESVSARDNCTNRGTGTAALEGVTLLSGAVRSAHSTPEVARLSSSIRNIELVFLAGSSRSLQSKLNSALELRAATSTEELPAATTLQLLRRVLTCPPLLVICLQLFLSNSAIGIVLVHYVQFCLQTGSDLDTVSLSLSMHGLALTLARFMLGSVGQDGRVDPLCVYVGLALLTALLMVLTPLLALTPTMQVVMQVFLGVYSGGSYALLTEITIQCAGVDTLSLAFGMEMISAGLGFLVAPPIAGWMVVLTKSYSNAIFLAGSISFMAAFVAMAIAVTRPVWKPPEEPDVTDTYVIAGADDRTGSSTETKSA